MSAAPIDDTVEFISRHLPRPPARVLEVGCGDGGVARRLMAAGHRVIAVDSSETAVVEARRRGVEAQLVRWPAFHAEPFDVIAFTRSLHHIDDLDGALAHARRLLEPEGALLVEDFALEEVGEDEIRWLNERLADRAAAGVAAAGEGDFMDQLQRRGGTLAAWRALHDDVLHASTSIAAALRRHFERVSAEAVPYLYRYLSEDLAAVGDGGGAGAGGAADADAFVARLLEGERRAAAAGSLRLIGRRFIATS